MVAFGSLVFPLALYGSLSSLWHPMAPYQSLYMVLYNSLWLLMPPFCFLDIYGSRLVPYGSLWISIAPYDSIWLAIAPYGFLHGSI